MAKPLVILLADSEVDRPERCPKCKRGIGEAQNLEGGWIGTLYREFRRCRCGAELRFYQRPRHMDDVKHYDARRWQNMAKVRYEIERDIERRLALVMDQERLGGVDDA